jgi:hypothetical protein
MSNGAGLIDQLSARHGLHRQLIETGRMLYERVVQRTIPARLPDELTQPEKRTAVNFDD